MGCTRLGPSPAPPPTSGGGCGCSVITLTLSGLAMTHSNLHQLTDALGPAQDIVSNGKISSKIRLKGSPMKFVTKQHFSLTCCTQVLRTSLSLALYTYVCKYVRLSHLGSTKPANKVL